MDQTTRPFRSVCVFCGASAGRRPSYAAAAAEFGRLLARHRMGLITGGGRVGLMGAIADAALGEGGSVTGVIPRGLVDRELAHPGLTALEVVDTLHERKARMSALADAFVALPGGLGTLEELSEIVSWAQLGLHSRPIGLLDVDGYWQPYVRWLEHAEADGFLRPGDRSLLTVRSTGDELLEAMSEGAVRPAGRARWAKQEVT